MKVLVFGNPLVRKDSISLRILPKLREAFPDVEFKEFDAAENLESEGKDLVILDAAEGIREVSLIEDIGSLSSGKIYSMHDFDLAITLKLLMKLGRLQRVRIIAIPCSFSAAKALAGARRLLSSLSSKSG
ncbi:MAG: hypothetical protein AB1324_01225 [Candidatus Micrarchaeota archaeon]